MLADPPFGDRALVIIVVMVAFAVALTIAGVAAHRLLESLRVSEEEEDDWLP